MLSDVPPISVLTVPTKPTMWTRAAARMRSRSFWAMADQGVASASNFVMVLLLGRYMTREELGLFSLPWELMTFLNSLHAALIVYPLSVRGARLDADRLRQISFIGIMITAVLVLPFGATMFAIGTYQGIVLGLCAAAAIASFQLHETLRRSLMAHFRYTDLIWGDMVGYFGQAGAVVVMAKLGHLTVAGIFGSMAISFLLASGVQWLRLRPEKTPMLETRDVTMEFWVLGRWMLASNLSFFFTGFAVQWSLAHFNGFDDVGNFQALANLLKLGNPMVAAMSGLIVPAVAASGRARSGLRYAVLGIAVLAPYYAMLLLAPRFVITALYAEKSAQYINLIPELRLSVATSMSGYATAMLLAVLGGLGNSRGYFYAQLINTIASILFVIPAAAIWGWKAVLVAGLCAMIATGVTAFLLLLRMRGRHIKPTGHGHEGAAA